MILPYFLHFAGDVCGEIIRRRADRLETERGQARLDVGLGQNFGDAGLQLRGDGGWQILRTPQPIPRHELETRQAGFLDRRNVRRRGLALEACDGERLDAAALRLRQRRQHRIGEQLDLPAHQIGQRRAGALIGDHQRVDVGLAL